MSHRMSQQKHKAHDICTDQPPIGKKWSTSHGVSRATHRLEVRDKRSQSSPSCEYLGAGRTHVWPLLGVRECVCDQARLLGVGLVAKCACEWPFAGVEPGVHGERAGGLERLLAADAVVGAVVLVCGQVLVQLALVLEPLLAEPANVVLVAADVDPLVRGQPTCGRGVGGWGWMNHLGLGLDESFGVGGPFSLAQRGKKWGKGKQKGSTKKKDSLRCANDFWQYLQT